MSERTVDARGVLDEAIRGLTQVLMDRRVCIDDAEAKDIAEACLLDVWQQYAGSTVYFRRTLVDLIADRDRRLYQDHRAGIPITQLVRRYKLSDRHVYRIIRRIENLGPSVQQCLF